MLSFWEKNSFLRYDTIIIGSGIVGLSAACSIKEKQPNQRVLVLERGNLPTGASTKNAGFATFAGAEEIIADLKKSISEEEIVALVNSRWQGLQMLRQRLGDAAIDYQNNGGNELILKDNNFDEGQIQRVNNLLMPIFGKDVFELRNDKISEFGFNKSEVKALIHTKFEGQIDTGKMMRSLLSYSRKLNVEIITGCEVLGFEDDGNKVNVETKSGMKFQANKLVICTNAFAKELLPEEDVTPSRGQVLATSVIPNLKPKGIFYFDDGYYYFRNFEGRIIFGGGRNLDFKTEETTDFALNNSIQSRLEYYLETLIIPNQNFEIEHRWAGIMAFGKNKIPIVKKTSPNVIIGVRMGGMGVALGSKVGAEIADLVLN
ncbi:MAG: FAD-dependent oxidoreductase [Bacteroidetes bacterium]|nr:FAD-dependent oxidoreductase [Bacteroidota bacterium]